jgi:predicted transcriptional regulator of viral defense system
VKPYDSDPPSVDLDVPGMEVRRASERVTLACKALSAAANDLRVAYSRSGMTTVDDAAETVGAETERVCELAEELEKLARNLRGRSLLAQGRSSG